MKNTILTFGHSNRSISEFLQKLQENNIDTLVDVRTFPRSRFCPHFNQNRLSESLEAEKITYLFKGNNLGGYEENTDYEESISELVEMVQNGKRVCVMCSEGDYKKCHRHETLQPSFEEQGLEVKHIEW